MNCTFDDQIFGKPDETLVKLTDIERWPYPIANVSWSLNDTYVPLESDRFSIYGVAGVFESLIAIATSTIHPEANSELGGREFGTRLDSTEVLDGLKVFAKPVEDGVAVVVTCLTERLRVRGTVTHDTLHEISKGLSQLLSLMLEKE